MGAYGVILLSGGLDSATVAAYARARAETLTALTFYYGQTHSKEVECARKVAEVLAIPHRLLDISFFGGVAWYSALTSPQLFPLPQDRPMAEMGSAIPITYVPLRNTLFLTLAAALLESQVLRAIEAEGVAPAELEARLFIAANAVDYSGYPDCRPEYFLRMGEALKYGSKLWAQYRVPIQLATPVVHLSKAGIVRMGMELQAPLEHTWSCYQAGPMPCGRCDSCILRAKGFQEAGAADPLLLRLGAV